jgi:hypothetical protein
MLRKLTARKHVCASPRWNTVPMESQSDGQHAGYFPRTLRTLLSLLGFGEPPLFVSTPRLLRWNSYLWHVCMIIYERSMTDHIHRIRQVVEASAPRWTFKGGMRDAVKRLWPFYDMKRMTKWSIHSTITSRATPDKELKLWLCPLDIATALGVSSTK